MALDTRIRVVIIEHHELVLHAICKLTEQTCEVVGTAVTGRGGVLVAEKAQPDIVLLAISLPDVNGLDVARQIKLCAPSARLIFVTVHRSLAVAREAFELGGSGYVLKQGPSSDLLTAIEEVARGHFFLSPLLKATVAKMPEGTIEIPSFRTLSKRQVEVLQLVGEGKVAKEIAAELHLSTKTVEFHKKHLMKALSVRTSAGLIRYAVEQELGKH